MKPTASGRKPATAPILSLMTFPLSLAPLATRRLEAFSRPLLVRFTESLRRGLGRSCTMALLGVLLCVGIGSWSPVRAAATGEYQVKAAFLYNFLKFVDWPADAISSPSTICIGVIGRNPFEGALDTLKGKSAKGRRVVVSHFRSIDEVKGCDLLYVGASEKPRLSQILRQAHNFHMLTVSDQDGFCEAGGMINLIFIKNRVGFDINVAAASRARLKISSQLLKLAHDVLE